MRKFLTRITIFFAAVVVIDFCFGLCMEYLNVHAKSGGVAKRNYISKECNEDILLFGSSRMSHHCVPQIVEDSLGMTCYNCGEDGNGIILAYGYLQMILERYTPKMIIYDFEYVDLFQDDNMKHVALLKPYCRNPKVMEIISSVSSKERWKLKSNLYRYNSLVIRIVGASIRNGSNNNKGYVPLKKSMNYEPKLRVYSEFAVDTVKLKMLQSFIQECQNHDIKLVFTLSPRYMGETYGVKYPEIREICKQYGIPLYDYYGYTDISDVKECFADQTHMTYRGAEPYTRALVHAIKTDMDNVKCCQLD